MIPRDKRQAPQRDLLETYLEDILNPRHELVQMGKRIDWTACEQHFGQLYAVEAGRPGLPIRLHVGLQLLKHMYALSDRGYRGSESTFLSRVHITGKRRGKAHPDQQHRRNSIEPIIGHLKSDGLMFRNFLRGFMKTAFCRAD